MFSITAANLQFTVVVFTKQLQEAQDWLHDGYDDAHLIFILVLIACAALPLRHILMLVGFRLPSVSGEGLLCDRSSFKKLLSHFLCHYSNLLDWKMGRIVFVYAFACLDYMVKLYML